MYRPSMLSIHGAQLEVQMESEVDPVIAACEAEWDRWKSDCSGFAKAVARRLGIVLSGQANSMIDSLEASARWINLGADDTAAMTRANMGYLVVGGLKARGHGHVVIVVKAPSVGYPTAYWGRFGSVGKKRTGINWSWNRADLHRVHFYAAMP
jgi:hypothetical protein